MTFKEGSKMSEDEAVGTPSDLAPPPAKGCLKVNMDEGNEERSGLSPPRTKMLHYQTSVSFGGVNQFVIQYYVYIYNRKESKFYSGVDGQDSSNSTETLDNSEELELDVIAGNAKRVPVQRQVTK